MVENNPKNKNHILNFVALLKHSAHGGYGGLYVHMKMSLMFVFWTFWTLSGYGHTAGITLYSWAKPGKSACAL